MDWRWQREPGVAKLRVKKELDEALVVAWFDGAPVMKWSRLWPKEDGQTRLAVRLTIGCCICGVNIV